MPEERLRASQERILTYTSGKMGISAVPGSGKTWTLSRLAVKLVTEVELQPDQEILIVTFSNSAVDVFANRIAGLLRERGVLSGLGYRVRTLHGLANDIIRERPELAGLTNEFQILGEADTDAILSTCVSAWYRNNHALFEDMLADGLNPKQKEKVTQQDLPDLIKESSLAFIKTAKDYLLTPELLEKKLESSFLRSNPLMKMGLEIYRDYQNALQYRAAVDFADLIRLAYQCLREDPSLTSLLQYRWPYILEDEAQDSSLLQEKILRELVGPYGNWVRVGDPNQAIYQSFTTANPNLLKSFLKEEGVRSEPLPESGRSCPEIIDLANYLSVWTRTAHPVEEVREALTLPLIETTQPDDPQPNPDALVPAITLDNRQVSPELELRILAESVTDWLKKYPDTTVVVLALINKRVNDIVAEFRRRKIEVSDALTAMPENSRVSVGLINLLLSCLLKPDNAEALAKAFQVSRRELREDKERWDFIKACSSIIKKCEQVEDYLYPRDGADWLRQLEKEGTPAEVLHELLRFRELVRKWHMAAHLPPDQFILAAAMDLELDNLELASIHKSALLLREFQDLHPEWTLTDLNDELLKIAKSERRFSQLATYGEGFDPEAYRGKVVVATLHKAKGLEWDKVFISSANSFDFPTGKDEEALRGEKYFLRGKMNMQAEMVALLRSLAEGTSQDVQTKSIARADVARERLRLLYVGITRAKRSLTISFNTGRDGKQSEALAVSALRAYLERKKSDQPAS
ncbi:MAG: ATP-dependent helicase [Chloroflexi bacterium]|jgi:DNA helicase-2/ATP-dependent DNA helicase PcrA|nr:ATP-dependent helicase [Chloroflexota bacterium]HOE35436.1 ATP-dependent helicase [Anaerolineaceae bacterium]HOT24905.1 ATP-dependent helicase [Anaerolineaceae bacterium]HQH57498.1 ATP-dependent helicase [Anaerolineaceae bacterium]HQK03024.1 ATP-dependent helicase [Anaerolineaceae bacterium]